MTMLTQENLDTQQAAVRRARRLLDTAAAMAAKAADELCNGGEETVSRDVGMIGAELRLAAAHAEAAYRMARTLEVPTPAGLIRPQSGKD